MKKLRPIRRKEVLTKEILKMYFKDKMSCNDIAKKFRCNPTLVQGRIKREGYKLRSASEAHKLKPARYWLGKHCPNSLSEKSKEKRRKWWRENKNKEKGRKILSNLGGCNDYRGKNNPFYGRKHSEETKRIIKERTPRFFGRNNPFYGKTHDDKTRRIIKMKRTFQITPKKDTKIEVKIQKFLKKLKIDFFTHQYIKEIEHGYQCDILIPSMNLVIECDGDYWHKYPVGRDIDHIRTKELIENGFKVLRLWEFEIKAMTINKFKNKLEEVKDE